MEAVKVGYTITKVHAYYEFQYYESLFKKFVESAYNRRLQNPGNNAINITAKLMLNGYTGKNGQIGVRHMVRLLIGDDAMNSHNSEKTTTIWNSRMDDRLGAFITEDVNLEYTPYALFISVWILSWSRVIMSRFTRKIDGYRNQENVPVYGDTDSLYIPVQALEGLDLSKEVGKQLGQMKDELPDAKIIGIKKVPIAEGFEPSRVSPIV